MPLVEVELGARSYTVNIARNALAHAPAWEAFRGRSSVLVVTNDVVAPLYLERVCAMLNGADTNTLVLPDGERTKNAANWQLILDRLVEMGAGRDACLVALGGGVTGDISGFAAATYMRGIDLVQVPTTLLAQVDSSVGGKTAINHPRGKNLVGAFHQPVAVIVATETLQTLAPRHYRAGMAEVIKYGAIRDQGFLRWLEQRADEIKAQEPSVLENMIETCVRHKSEVVAQDELESGQRALLNFGHSFGHAIEAVTHYREWLHGEAVSVGMVIAATLSEARGLCAPGAANCLKSLLAVFGLPVSLPRSIESGPLLDAMALDKKNLGGKARLILLKSAGCAMIDSMSTREEIESAIRACR